MQARPTRLINLTGHDITLLGEGERRYTQPPDGHLRVDSTMNVVEMLEVDGVQVPLLEIAEQRLTPTRRQEDSLYVVSGIVQARMRYRDDYVTPSRIVRATDRYGRPTGEIEGCRALARVRRQNGDS